MAAARPKWITARFLARAWLAAGLTLALSAAKAATVSVEGFTESGAAVVRLSGKIVAGDAKKLLNATATIQRAIIVLDSKGGMVGEGIRIGTIVRSRAFTTYVPARSECASMCGVIWLTGQTRWLDQSSKVGFHAAYNAQDKEVSGSANAMIGAFLQSIGLGIDMIGYVATAGPTRVSWMTVEKAAKLGVSFSIARPEQIEVKDRRPVPGSLSPVAALANANRYSCDLPTARLILDAMGKDRDAWQAFLKENSGAINRQCHAVQERTQLTIETFHTELPMACVRRPAGAPCEWMQLSDLTVTPDVSVPSVEARPAQQAAPPAGSDPRRAYASRVGTLGERDVCRLYLAGNQEKTDEPYDVVIAEVSKRKLTADRCGGVIACSDPGMTARAKSAHALACQDKLGTVGIVDLCAAALAPGKSEWRDDPAFYWVRAEIRQRVVDVAACRKLLAPDTAMATGPSPVPVEAALRNALPGMSDAGRDRVAKAFAAMPSHRALARSAKGTWRQGNVAQSDDAEVTALEACQLTYGQPCWLVAVDDAVSPPEALGEASARDMPRLSYAGSFDPARIPLISRTRRAYRDVTDYAAARASKASAIHERGIFVIVADAPSAFEAEQRALDMCGAAVSATPPAEPCTLYSTGDDVVIVRRSHQPISPPPS